MKLEHRSQVTSELRKRLENFVVDANGCHLWKGYVREDGYGSISVFNYPHQVHCVSFVIHKSDIPKGLFVCHSCDVRHCINPAHLWPGTQKDNIQDAVKKGRMRGVPPVLYGSANGNSKFNDAEVGAIRKATGSLRSIATRFGTTHKTVGLIKKGLRR